jgi:hypothetical protein
MVGNTSRSSWAKKALKAFAKECMPGKITEETVSDLICDLGHFAERELALHRGAVLNLFERAIATWSAEAQHPDGEPWDHDACKISFGRNRV